MGNGSKWLLGRAGSEMTEEVTFWCIMNNFRKSGQQKNPNQI